MLLLCIRYYYRYCYHFRYHCNCHNHNASFAPSLCNHLFMQHFHLLLPLLQRLLQLHNRDQQPTANTRSRTQLTCTICASAAASAASEREVEWEGEGGGRVTDGDMPRNGAEEVNEPMI
jgi:hypothetical protein